MPSPNSPPFIQAIADLVNAVNAQTVVLQSIETAVLAQKEDVVRAAQLARYQAESFYGANPDVTGIWDGTDRYV